MVAGMRLLPAALVLALSLSSLGRAHAQPGNTPPGQTAPNRAYLPVPQLERPLPPQTRTVGYGTHVFLADLATWVLIAASTGSDDDFSGLAAFGLVFGGPVVHLAHGNTSGAALSVLARGGLPLVGGTFLYATCSEEEQRDEFLGCLGHFATGMVIGYGTALVIDWFVLAKKEEQIAPTGWASLSPSLSVQRESVHAGIAGAF